jgi:hypothetical protein
MIPFSSAQLKFGTKSPTLSVFICYFFLNYKKNKR